MAKKKGCPVGMHMISGKCIPDSKKSLEFKTQIIKAPKGWGQWYTQPISKDKIKITWARPKKQKYVLYGTADGMKKKFGTYDSREEAITAQGVHLIDLENSGFEGRVKWNIKKKGR